MLFSFAVCSGNSQSDIHVMVKNIEFYSDITANASRISTRLRANDSLLHYMDLFIHHPDAFNVILENKAWISEKGDAGHGFKVYTWHLEVENGHFEYFGYILSRTLGVIPLSNNGYEVRDSEYMELSPSEWLGAMYYNVTSHRGAEGLPYFILYGITRVNPFTIRKTAEVLSFPGDQVVFGKEVFYSKDESSRVDVKSRIVIQYSSDAQVTLNFHEGLGMIFFENLIPRMGTRPGQGPTWVPDGSYRGYIPENGVWNYVDKVYHQISETPPRPNPVLDGDRRQKDLFGKPKNR
ncbi:MAG TPA: hypothetical protein PKC30_13095 [Saprospiraceae bacterium]|nr:hypothetical protein [Saprospiraceae bacterium]